MIQPERALVKPRVLCPASGEALPLEDEVRALLETGARGVVAITGPAGAGKTTALRHLAAVFPATDRLKFLNGPFILSLPQLSHSLVICAGHVPPGVSRVASYTLAGWHKDEWLEYLLAAHPARCASVLQRVCAAPDRASCPPVAGLWRVVLDQMAADPEVTGVREALLRFLR